MSHSPYMAQRTGRPFPCHGPPTSTADDPARPPISPTHAVDPKFAAPLSSTSHLLPIRPVPLSHLQSGQSPTLARVKTGPQSSTAASTGTPPAKGATLFRPIGLSGSPSATSTPISRCAGSTRLPNHSGLDTDAELDWQLENGSRDSAFEDDLSCSRTTPINHTSIRNRKWRQHSCPGGARVKRETYPLEHSIEPISIETTGRRDSGFHSAGPLSAPGAFYPNSFLPESSAVSPLSHTPGLVSPSSTTSSLPSPRAPNLLPSMMGSNATGLPLLPPFTPTPPSPVVSPEPTSANASYLHNPILASPLLHPMHPLNYRWPAESMSSPFYLCTGMPYPPSLLWNPSLFRLYPPAAHSHPFESNNLTTSPMNPMNHHTHFLAANGHEINPHVLGSNRPLNMSSKPDIQDLSRNALNEVKLGEELDMKPINEPLRTSNAKGQMSHPVVPESKELLPGEVKIEIMDTTNLKDERDQNVTVTDEPSEKGSMFKTVQDQNGLYLLSRGIERLHECAETPMTSDASPDSDRGNSSGVPIFRRRLSRLDLLCDAASTLETPSEDLFERQVLSAPNSPKPPSKESNCAENRSKSLDGVKSALNRRYTSPEAERDVKAYLASKSKSPKRILDKGPKVNIVTPLPGGPLKSEPISEKELSMRSSMADIQRQYQEKYKQLFKLQHQCLKQKRNDSHPSHSASSSESPKSKKLKSTTTTATDAPLMVDSKSKMKRSGELDSGTLQRESPCVHKTNVSQSEPVIDPRISNDPPSHNGKDPHDFKSCPLSMTSKLNSLLKPPNDESQKLKSVLDSQHSKITKNSSKHGFKRSPETLYRWEVRPEPSSNSETNISQQKTHGHLLKFRPNGPSPFKNLLRLTNQDSSSDPALEQARLKKSDILSIPGCERQVPEDRIKIEVEPSINDSPAPSTARSTLLKVELPDHIEPGDANGSPNQNLISKSDPVCAVSANPIVKSEEECGVIKDLLTLKVKRPKSKKSKKVRKNMDSDDQDESSHSHHRRHRHHHHHQKSKRSKKAERRKSKELSTTSIEVDFEPPSSSGCHRRSCVLEESDLMTDTRILFRMDGYFYPGKIQEISPPDIYGVLVDHERGNKPHILTREEMLNEVILEMRPPSVESIPIGTRVCAFWSQKYHYLFPGKVGDPELVDARLGTDFVNIELDDGDSRDIALSDIRLLPVGYPIVQYEPDDIGRRRRKQSTDCSSAEASPLKSRLLVRTTNPATVIPKASLKVTLSVKGKTKEQLGSHQSASSGSSHSESTKPNVQSEKKDTGISAFLPSQQLWNWFGPPAKIPKKGRGRIIHTGIARKKEKLFTGDCAVFLSTGRPDRPFIGRLDSMWETSTGNKRVRVKWFYHAAETEGLANQGKRVQDLKLPGALFESMHFDENDLQTISHGCEVLEISKFRERTLQDRSKLDKLYENNDLYYLAGQYDPVEGTIAFANGVFEEG